VKSTPVIASALVVCLLLAGCVAKPVTAPRAVVPATVSSELRAAATTAKQFGDMVAIGVGVSNGSAKDYVITADRVLAVDKAGNRVAPLSVVEAARQAGGATALVAGLQGAGGAALLGIVGFSMLAAGMTFGSTFASGFAPRFGVDGLTAFFLGMLGVVAAPTFARICATWYFAVCAEMPSTPPISRFDRPLPSSSISCGLPTTAGSSSFV